MPHIKTSILLSLLLAVASIQTSYFHSAVSTHFEVRRVSRQNDATKKVDLSLPFARCWEYKTEQKVSKIAASDNEDVFISLQNGILEFLDPKSGNRFWRSDLGGETISDLAIGDKNVFLVLRNKETLFLKSVDKITGIIAWQKKIPLTGMAPDAVFLRVSEDRLILVAQTGECFAFTIDNGDVIWRRDTNRRLTLPPIFGESEIYAATDDKKLTVVSVSDGSELRHISAINLITAASQKDGKFFYGDERGSVFAVEDSAKNSFKNSILWERRVGGARISDITITTVGILVSSFDNFIYLISAAGGKRIWKRRLPGKILYKPLVSGKYAIVSTLFASDASVIELKSGKIVNRINLEEDNFFGDIFLLGENRLIAATLKGLVGFASSADGCSNVQSVE